MIVDTLFKGAGGEAQRLMATPVRGSPLAFLIGPRIKIGCSGGSEPV